MKYSPIAGYHERYKEGVNVMRLTFNDDYLEDEDGPYSKGMIVETNDKIHEGFAAKRWEQDFIPIVIDDETEWFHKCSFEEFNHD